MAIDTGWIDSLTTAVDSGDYDRLRALFRISTTADEEKSIRRQILGSLLSRAICDLPKCNPLFDDYLCERHLRCFEILLEYEADVNFVGSDGMTPLLKAAQYNVFMPYIEHLITRGGDLEARDQDGKTPLLVACSEDNAAVTCAEYLLEKGAFVNAQDNRGYTPIHYACRGRFEKLVELLLSFGSGTVAQGGEDNETPLHVASHQRQTVCAELLVKAGAAIESRDIEGNTPLLTAIKKQSLNCFKFLLLQRANPNAQDDEGFTALHIACDLQTYSLYIQPLIEARANLNINAKDGDTPIHVACSAGNSRALQLFITARADLNVDLNARASGGDTPLHIACSTLSRPCLQILLGAGANPDITNDDGNTPLHELVRSPAGVDTQLTMIQLLLNHGVNLGIQNLDGETVTEVAFFPRIRNLLTQAVVNRPRANLPARPRPRSFRKRRG